MSSQPPLASNMLTLICWVFDDKSAFPVDISPEKTIGHLKKAIVAEKPNRFHGIDADTLMLWKAEILDEDEAIKAFDINDAIEMRSTYEIGEYFKGPPKKHIHVVIKVPAPTPAPPSGKRRKISPLHDAVIAGGFSDKAIKHNAVHLSALSAEEKVNVLQRLGQDPIVEDTFTTLLNFAGELRKSGNSCQTIPDIISSSQKLPIIMRQELYVRECYKTLYDHITKLFISEVRRSNRLCIVGTSGIGKSSFFLYFILRLLSESKDPPIVIFHPRKGDWYAFGGTATLRRGTGQEFGSFLLLPEIWYLADSPPNPEVDSVQATSLYSMSPKKYFSDHGDYQEIQKHGPHVYCMAPWDLDELEKCRKAVFPSLSVDIVMNLYSKIGGIPRYVLEVAQENIEEAAYIEEAAFRRIQQALNFIQDVPNLLQCIAQGKDSLHYSSRLLHQWPDPNDPKVFIVRWASSYIEEKVLEALKEESWAYLLRDLIYSNKVNRVMLFELYVLHIFRKGGYTFEIKELFGEKKIGELQVPDKPTTKHFRKTKDLNIGITGKDLLIPEIPNFPCIDLILGPNKLLQVTVTGDYPLRQNHMKEIATTLRATALEVYFVVPGSIYDDFKPQNFLNEKGGISGNVPSIVRDIKQYALKVDLNTGASPGL